MSCILIENNETEAAINVKVLSDGEKGQHGPGLRPLEVGGVERDG